MTSFTEAQIEAFLAIVGADNRIGCTDRAEAINAGDDIIVQSKLVSTHETVEDFQKTHGKGRRIETQFGAMHTWSDAQLGRGKARGTIYLVALDGVNAVYFTGQA